MEEVIWLDVKGYEGRYQVSNKGRIKSLYLNRDMRTFVNNSGYECVKFKNNRKTENFTVHRLVAMHFVMGYEEHLHVNHIDGNRLNNSFSNLEWVTAKENIHDMIKRGTHNVSSAHKVAQIKNKKPVEMYDLEGHFIKDFPSIKDAFEETKVLKIGEVCNGRRKSAGGFVWKFKNNQAG